MWRRWILIGSISPDQTSGHPWILTLLRASLSKLGTTINVKEKSLEHGLIGKQHCILGQGYRNPCNDNILRNCFSGEIAGMKIPEFRKCWGQAGFLSLDVLVFICLCCKQALVHSVTCLGAAELWHLALGLGHMSPSLAAPSPLSSI